ncbi:hypothetical protein SAMN05444396_101477 [Flavobacterium segetis]|uniref:Uncharacterized protein n=1 Tax=Flavobacterium segetis TaxID=271157 RepID=A0A1M5EMN9_9FLAO|nr:hypothetical protein [Flavobacterium segetis]SHF80509.1 hypothetical protein SAMN05444396_101477 [Flavobacterium segetis]
MDNKKNEKKEDPCWNGYHQLGMKTKDSKKVPDCVPDEKAKTSKKK